MKKLLPFLLILTLLAACGAPAPQTEGGEKPRVVATVFPAYDFARAVAGECADVALLLPPGAESHSYEPTPADMVAVRDCDLFLCLGGESEAWVETLLDAAEPRGATLRMTDCVPLLDEEDLEGMEEEH
ncbi:MAG: zinc ABC transporter substrate-binding protein, partial [Oscillibacter sp.]|nr:zinc ABC transporter substrate-binding protein [Oscillibacter sp.]